MNYTSEEVRHCAKHVHPSNPEGYSGMLTQATAMLNAYADMIERAEKGVTKSVVTAVENKRTYVLNYLAKNTNIGRTERYHIAMRAALLTMWPIPPAQPAQPTTNLPENDSKLVGEAERVISLARKLSALVRADTGADASRETFNKACMAESELVAAIYKLAAPTAERGQASVEITDSAGKFIYVNGDILPAGTKLYTHPVPPAAPTAEPVAQGEPVAWQYRRLTDEGWGIWFGLEADHLETVRRRTDCEVRALGVIAAAPSAPEGDGSVS